MFFFVFISLKQIQVHQNNDVFTITYLLSG